MNQARGIAKCNFIYLSEDLEKVFLQEGKQVPIFSPFLFHEMVLFSIFFHVLFIIFLISLFWALNTFRQSSTVVIIYHFTIYLLCCLLTLNKCTTRQKFLASIYLLSKVNNGKTRTKCEICSKLTVKTLFVVLVSLL